MSNYTQTTIFTPKDSLPPSNPAKTIFGAAYDVEFGNISTAIASKVDTSSAASLLSVNVTGSSIPANGIYLPSANTLGFATNSTNVGSISSTGLWTIPTPTASNGVSLLVNGLGTGGYATLALVSPFSTYMGISAPSGQEAGIYIGGNGTNTAPTYTTGALFLRSKADSSATILNNAAGGTLGIGGNSTVAITCGNLGQVTIIAPSSLALTPLTIQGTSGGGGWIVGTVSVNNSITCDFTNSSTGTAASSYIRFLNSADNFYVGLTGTGYSGSFLTGGPTGESAFISTSSTQALALGTAGTARLIIGGSGGVTIPVATGSNTLTVSSAAGENAVSILGSSTTGQSLGLIIEAGTNSSDYAMRVYNYNASTTFMLIYGDGSVVCNSATGGAKGAGTINCSGLYVNGVAVTVP